MAKKSTPTLTDLARFSSSCAISKFLSGIGLRDFALVSSGGISLSSFITSSSCTSRWNMVMVYVGVFFVFFLEMSAVVQGFFSIVSCIRKVPRRSHIL